LSLRDSAGAIIGLRPELGSAYTSDSVYEPDATGLFGDGEEGVVTSVPKPQMAEKMDFADAIVQMVA
jgi:hypothetical protein